jgi:hypothetical protein
VFETGYQRVRPPANASRRNQVSQQQSTRTDDR